MNAKEAMKRAAVEALVGWAFLWALAVLFGPTFGLVQPTSGRFMVSLAIAFIYVAIRAYVLARRDNA
jgi:hypothetical protein